MSNAVVIQRLLLSAVLAGLVGYERERVGRAAGLRTHILVCVGSCLMMLTGLDLMEGLAGRFAVDPTRLAAQVVSGIGFLGAGTILRFRASVRGLTTAASLWAVAGVGLAVGTGFLVGAIASTGVVLLTLLGLSRWERRIRKSWQKMLIVESAGSAEGLDRLRQTLSEYDVEILHWTTKPASDPSTVMVELNLKMLSDRDEGVVLSEVSRLEGTRRAYWA